MGILPEASIIGVVALWKLSGSVTPQTAHDSSDAHVGRTGGGGFGPPKPIHRLKDKPVRRPVTAPLK